MKKPTQNNFQRLLILMSLSFVSLNSPLAQAKPYTETDLNYLVKTGYHQNYENLTKPRKSFVCNGNVVKAPDVIKRQLACLENDQLASKWVQLLINPSTD